MEVSNVTYIGERRKRDNDVIVVEIANGRVIVDNTDKFYGVNHVLNRMPGTIEYLQLQRRRRDEV